MQQYKLSYYSVISKPVNSRGQYVIYSTRTGNMMLVSEYCFKALAEDMIEQIPQNIKDKLINGGFLVHAEEIEIEEIVKENREFTAGNTNELYEVIQPTAMCQLGCYYCGQKHSKDYLSEDLIEKLVTRIHSKFTTGGYRKIYIGWFGGEPLMGLPQMRTIYRKLKSIVQDDTVPIAGKMVTNGMSLKEGIFEELITGFNINQIEITLDGLGTFHDQHRYTKSGEPSFEIIYRNLRDMLKSPAYAKANCKIIIRCNVDEKNYDGVEPLIRRLAEDNLHTKISRLYFIGIYSWGGNDAHKKALTKERFAMMRLKWDILKLRLGYHHRPKLYERKKQTCVATGGVSEVYDAFGNIFNCTEVPYADVYEGSGYKLGNLKEDHLSSFSNKPLHDWYDTVKDSEKYPCHTCKLFPICGGSCPKSWIEGNPACPPFKFGILKEIELEYLLRKTQPGELDHVLAEFSESLEENDFYRLE